MKTVASKPIEKTEEVVALENLEQTATETKKPMPEKDSLERHTNTNWETVLVNGKDYPRYSVSDAGDVYDTWSKRYVISTETDHGYRVVNLNLNGEWKKVRVHRLVAERFVPNPNNYPEVDHINADKFDNRAENLEWVTSKENKRRAFNMGLYPTGTGRWNAKSTEEQVRQACELLEKGELQNVVAEKTGLTLGTIHSIMGRRSWKDISQQYLLPKPNEGSTFRRDSKYTPEQIKDVCRRLQDGQHESQIEQETGIDHVTVHNIREGKLFARISKDYQIQNGRGGPEYGIQAIHDICKLLERGMQPAQIAPMFPNVPIQTIQHVKQKLAYKDISSQYSIPEVKDWKRSYREDVVKLIKQGLRFDQILAELGMEDTRPNRKYLAGVKNTESKKPENANNPIFQEKPAQVRKPRLYSEDQIRNVCIGIIKGMSNTEIRDRYQVKLDLVDDIRHGKRFAHLFEQLKGNNVA